MLSHISSWKISSQATAHFGILGLHQGDLKAFSTTKSRISTFNDEILSVTITLIGAPLQISQHSNLLNLVLLS
jgi:hypothetical protein